MHSNYWFLAQGSISCALSNNACLCGVSCVVASCSLGGAQHCLNTAAEYINERSQFGRPLSDNQVLYRTNGQRTKCVFYSCNSARYAVLSIRFCKVRTWVNTYFGWIPQSFLGVWVPPPPRSSQFGALGEESTALLKHYRDHQAHRIPNAVLFIMMM